LKWTKDKGKSMSLKQSLLPDRLTFGVDLILVYSANGNNSGVPLQKRRHDRS